jgi:hypothetical protein
MGFTIFLGDGSQDKLNNLQRVPYKSTEKNKRSEIIRLQIALLCIFSRQNIFKNITFGTI